MTHKHGVTDSNERFVIDPVTREITNGSAKKIKVMQFDHNSERFTFEIPKVDGHNMAICDKVEIHYINIDAADKSLKSEGVYEVNDIQNAPDNNGVSVFSWLLSRNCTKYAGTLSFLIHFACTTDGVEDYAWNTAIFQSITIGNGMNNGADVVEPFPDILAQWKAQLFSASETAVLNVTTAETNALAAIEAAGEAKKQSVLDSIPDEYEALSALADQNHRNKAGAIVLDAQGESIVVNDASEHPLHGLKLFGKSTQDGTPTPDAPVDIVSVENPMVTVCGKNLLNLDLLIDDNFVKNADGSYTMTKTGVGDLRFSAKANLRLGKGTYTLSVGNLSGTDTAVRFVFTHANGQEVSHSITPTNPKTIHVTDNITKFSVCISTSLADGTYVTMRDVMLEAGSEATDYEPYKATQTVESSHILPGIPVASGGNYTDENGQQWVCDEVDLKRGVYVQRIKKDVLDGNEPWKMSTTDYGEVTYFFAAYSDMINTNGDNMGAVMCDMFIESYNINTIEHIRVHGMAGQLMLFIKTNRLDEVSTSGLKGWFAEHNANLMYQLATPIETPLSETEINAFRALHSNKPTTTILNDAGAFMAVSYVADTKTYIDNRISALLSNA